jgi:hypothetical protein
MRRGGETGSQPSKPCIGHLAIKRDKLLVDFKLLFTNPSTIVFDIHHESQDLF